MIKLAVAQIDTVLGDLDANLAKHLAKIDEAVQAKADLVVFPELSLTGYALQDLTSAVARPASAEDPMFESLLEASRNRFFNSAAYLSKGEILHVHQKVYLPTYGLFDEGRFFALGDSIRAFDTPLGRVGVLICEDFWHASPPYLLWLDGTDILLFMSASPGRGLDSEEALESARWVEHVAQAYASLFTNFVANVGRVGFEDGLGFWGGSVVFDPHGELVARGPFHEEHLFVAELDLNQLHRARTRLPLLRDERTELVQRELMRIRHSRMPGSGGPRKHSE